MARVPGPGQALCRDLPLFRRQTACTGSFCVKPVATGTTSMALPVPFMSQSKSALLLNLHPSSLQRVVSVRGAHPGHAGDAPHHVHLQLAAGLRHHHHPGRFGHACGIFATTCLFLVAILVRNQKTGREKAHRETVICATLFKVLSGQCFTNVYS